MTASDKPCDVCDGTGCPCLRWRDWQSMELGCECGCEDCGRDAEGNIAENAETPT